MNIQWLHDDFMLDDPGILRYVRLSAVKCMFPDSLLGGYDGSLDDDPESDFTYPDVSLARAIGHAG
jgi:hypothetical protein